MPSSFCPEAAEWSAAWWARWTTARYRSLCAWSRLAFTKIKFEIGRSCSAMPPSAASGPGAERWWLEVPLWRASSTSAMASAGSNFAGSVADFQHFEGVSRLTVPPG